MTPHDHSRRDLPAEWLTSLRARMTEITARRVSDEAVEDLVQDALEIIVRRSRERDEAAVPDLRWCFQILRNVIGNWYQKRRAHVPLDPEMESSAPDPLARLTVAERTRQVREAMVTLRHERENCARWLWALARGSKPRDLAAAESVDANLFYRRVYKCRRRLQEILVAKGVSA